MIERPPADSASFDVRAVQGQQRRQKLPRPFVIDDQNH